MTRKRRLRNYTKHSRNKKTPLEPAIAQTGQEKVSLNSAAPILDLTEQEKIDLATLFPATQLFALTEKESFISHIMNRLREYSLNLALAAVLLALFVFLGAMTYLYMLAPLEVTTFDGMNTVEARNGKQ